MGRVNNGAVKPMMTDKNNKRMIRIISASDNPTILALRCFSTGNLPATMEIKIILSTPNTISRKVNVNKLIQVLASEKI